MKRILVTGATGFIGKHVTALMDEQSEKDLDFIAWDRLSMGDLLQDSNRQFELEKLAPHVVLHLAWSTTANDHYHEGSSHAVWTEESLKFMNECLRRKIWFIATGSAVDAKDDKTSATPYACAKRELRSVVEASQELGNVTLLRPQYIVSIEDERPRVVREYLRSRSKETFELSNPSVELDFIHVSDVASGIKVVIDNGVMGTVDLGSGSLHKVSELISAVEISRSGRSINTVPINPSSRTSATRSEALIGLGWTPIHTHKLFGEVAT